MRSGPRVLLAASFLAGCASAPPPGGSPAERIETRARLLRAEETRTYNAELFGRGAASPDPEIRRQTALSAGRLREASAGALLPRLLADPDPAVRRAAAFAAGLSGDRSLVAALSAALADADPGSAANAADALGKLGGPEAEAALLSALERPSPVRAAAALALWRAPSPETLRSLSAIAVNPAAPAETRRAAVYSLSRRPKTEGQAALRAVLRRKESREA